MEIPTVYYPSRRSDWGPAFWNFIHNFATKYPDNPKRYEKLAAKDTIRRFVDAIPCNDCENDFKNYIQSNPPNLDNKTDLFNWTVNAHNYVNKKLGKPTYYAVIGKQPEMKKETVIVKEPSKTISLGMSNNDFDLNKLTNFGLGDFDKAFPMYNSLDDAINYDMNPQPKQTQVQDPTIPITSETEIKTMESDLDHSLAQFNSIYQFPADSVGLKPVELNLIYTPQILSAISQLIVETNMTEFGAMTVSLLASLGVIGSSLFMRQTLSHGDKLLIQTVAANYLSNTLKYTNPKSLHNIMEDGQKFVDLLFNWGKKDKEDPMKTLFETFILTPTMSKEKEKKLSDEEMTKGLARIAGKAFMTDEFGNPVAIDNDIDIDPRSFGPVAKAAYQSPAFGGRLSMTSNPRPTTAHLNTIPSPLSYEQDMGLDAPLDDYPLY